MPSTFPVGDQPTTTPIRGREDELKKIAAHVKALSMGCGGVLVIEGAPGIGKSRLVSEAMVMAENAGARTLFGEAFDYQQAVPFFALFTATLQADPPVGDVVTLRRLGSSADRGYWVVHELQHAIRAAAAQTPLAIVLEDIHWADDSTLLALRSLATQHDGPVLWVLTARSGVVGPAARETLGVLRRANATFLRVTPMPASAVIDMVADELRANMDESLEKLVARAKGNPFLVRKIVTGLREDGRLAVSRGRAVATGDDLPRSLNWCMKQRLDQLSDDASELVRVAAVLPDRFSARLLAAMLERQPASLVSSLAEAVRAGILFDDGEQLRFGHDLLREATRNLLPQSLCRAIERQSASIMLCMGSAPTEVATQLARSAEPGDREAITALRQAAQAVSHSDASAAADLSKRALQLMPAEDDEHGRVVAETVGLLNRARRYEESEELAVAALSGASAEDEAEIRLRLPSFTRHSAQRRVAENRRALELNNVSAVTRARHLALLAYNLMLDDKAGQQRPAADEAAAAAATTGDLAAKIVADLTLTCFDGADGQACRALRNLEELCALGHTNDLPVAHLLATNFYANLLAVVGRLDEAADQVAIGMQRARRERNALAVEVWATIDGTIHLAAGRLADARGAVEGLPPPESTGATELDLVRMGVLAQVAASIDDRNLLQQMASQAHDAYLGGASVVRRMAAYVLALAAWHRDDPHDALRWFGDDIELFGTLSAPQALDHVILGARIASAAGDAGLRARVQRAVDKLRHDEREIPLFAAVARYVAGILDGDADALARAAELLRSSSRPLLYAAAAEDAGSQLILSDREDEALNQLNAAFETYTCLGAFADARRVGRTLRRLGVERRIVSQPRAKTGWDSLTDSELRVVNLIAGGASNRAAADQLQLSLHTVKNHVHNAFGKLGVSSRGQLAHVTQ
jgi:DNA-binding CsgD family transcriptional regulator